MEELFKQWTFYMASGIEAGAGIIIGLAALQAIFKALWVFIAQTNSQSSKEDIRLQLGRWLGVALEFELAADILRTAIAPTWNEIGQLAAIVILRTVLNYFLQKEIDQAADRNSARENGGASRSQGVRREWPPEVKKLPRPYIQK